MEAMPQDICVKCQSGESPHAVVIQFAQYLMPGPWSSVRPAHTNSLSSTLPCPRPGIPCIIKLAQIAVFLFSGLEHPCQHCLPEANQESHHEGTLARRAPGTPSAPPIQINVLAIHPNASSPLPSRGTKNWGKGGQLGK